MNISSKRAEKVAILALVLSVIFFATAWVLGRASGSAAISALSWQILAGAFVWFVLVVQFHQRSLVEREKLDMAQLARDKGSETIFQANADQRAMFAVAGKRLVVLEKWFIPTFAVLIAVYQIAIGIYLFLGRPRTFDDIDLRFPQISAVFMVLGAFTVFLVSRYATGLSGQQGWKPLRAGGGYMLASAILSFAAAIALALAQFKILSAEMVLSWAIPILLVALGVETAINVVLDIYRPRVQGQYSRSALDSRLLGLLSEPGGLLHTFASAIDYQFGFKVSQTWFYRLLEKAVLPLVLFSMATLYALTCVTVVGPGQEAVIEHLGSFDGRVEGPGLCVKLPWPFDVAYKYPTKQVQQINIGFVTKDEDKKKNTPLLWGEKHYEEEYNLLVGTTAKGFTEEGAVPVSIVIAAVEVQYKIRDVVAYRYNHVNAEKMLEVISYRELMRFAASAKIETEGDEAGDKAGGLSLLGGGREYAGEVLKQRIQARADAKGLGIDIVFLGLQGVHPPVEVAEDYQKVVGAVQNKQALIYRAMAERDRILTSLSGSVAYASELYELAREYQNAKEEGDSEKIERISEQLTAAFAQAKGDIFKTLSEANSYAFERALGAKAAGERFEDQLKAYRAGAMIYKQELRLAMLEEALKNIRKYVVISDENDSEVIIVNLEDKLSTGLYDLDLSLIEEEK